MTVFTFTIALKDKARLVENNRTKVKKSLDNTIDVLLLTNAKDPLTFI